MRGMDICNHDAAGGNYGGPGVGIGGYPGIVDRS